jgi:rRNA maturation RNase YbeY
VPVEVSCDVESAASHVRVLRSDALRLLRMLKVGRVELSLLLTGDERIARMNREYRRRSGPTDVLSFSQVETVNGESVKGAQNAPLKIDDLLGDVVISIETAARQASKMGQSVDRRLRTLLVHGVLHLMGFDHERSPADERLMSAVQGNLEARLEKAEVKRQRLPSNAQ